MRTLAAVLFAAVGWIGFLFVAAAQVFKPAQVGTDIGAIGELVATGCTFAALAIGWPLRYDLWADIAADEKKARPAEADRAAVEGV